MKKKFKDTAVGSFLAKAAPSIVDAVGEVFPPAKLLGQLIGLDPSITDEDKLKATQMLEEYEIERIRLDNEDRANARNLQIAALGQSDNFSKRFTYYLAGMSVVLGFAYIFLITFMTIPPNNVRFADTVLGVVIGTIISTIYNFFFGSSSGSKEKDHATAKAIIENKELSVVK